MVIFNSYVKLPVGGCEILHHLTDDWKPINTGINMEFTTVFNWWFRFRWPVHSIIHALDYNDGSSWKIWLQTKNLLIDSLGSALQSDHDCWDLKLIESHGDDSDDRGSPILGNHLRKPPYTLDNGHEMNQSWSSFLGFFRFLKARPFWKKHFAARRWISLNITPPMLGESISKNHLKVTVENPRRLAHQKFWKIGSIQFSNLTPGNSPQNVEHPRRSIIAGISWSQCFILSWFNVNNFQFISSSWLYLHLGPSLVQFHHYHFDKLTFGCDIMGWSPTLPSLPPLHSASPSPPASTARPSATA